MWLRCKSYSPLHKFRSWLPLSNGAILCKLICFKCGRLTLSSNQYSYIFLIFYGLGIDVVGIVFYSEIFPNHLRAKGVAATIAVIVLTDLVYLQVAATAFAHAGWKFFLLFVLLSGLGAIWAYFFIPETKGLPLEEVAAIFGDREEIAVYSDEINVEGEVIEDGHADRQLNGNGILKNGATEAIEKEKAEGAGKVDNLIV